MIAVALIPQNGRYPWPPFQKLEDHVYLQQGMTMSSVQEDIQGQDELIFKTIESTARQYWQCVPVRDLNWDGLDEFLLKINKDDDPEDIEARIQSWFKLLTGNQKFYKYVNPDYHVRFIKSFMNQLEKRQVPVPEVAYESIGDFISLSTSTTIEPTTCYRRFSLPSSNSSELSSVWSLEDIATISSGTTGLRTWGASLCMLEYLAATKSSVLQGNRILELGSGCGVLGISLALLGSNEVILSDTHPLVLARLSSNLELNRETLDALERTVTVDVLDWQDITTLENMKPSMLVGADIVYDPSIIPTLVNLIRVSLQRNPHLSCVLACTIRNEGTFDLFLSALAESRILYTVTDISSYRSWFYYDERNAQVRCVDIYSNNNS